MTVAEKFVSENSALSCPILIQQYPTILLAYRSGGKLMRQLIEQMFLPTFGWAMAFRTMLPKLAPLG